MAKKSFADTESSNITGTQNDAWLQEKIRFEHGGKKYAVPIEGHLVLRELSLHEIKDKLNKLPGKYAYWKTLRVDVEIESERKQEEYDLWFSGKYGEVADRLAKESTKPPTETKIKNSVLLDNIGEYRKWMDKLRELSGLKRKVDVLVKTYDMQSWTLRSVGSLVQSELNNIEVTGRGNFGEHK